MKFGGFISNESQGKNSQKPRGVLHMSSGLKPGSHRKMVPLQDQLPGDRGQAGARRLDLIQSSKLSGCGKLRHFFAPSWEDICLSRLFHFRNKTGNGYFLISQKETVFILRKYLS